jgi:hypothetical protein
MDVVFDASDFDWVAVQVLQCAGYVGIDLVPEFL